MSFELGEQENVNQPVRYGSFYLRMGVTGDISGFFELIIFLSLFQVLEWAQ